MTMTEDPISDADVKTIVEGYETSRARLDAEINEIHAKYAETDALSGEDQMRVNRKLAELNSIAVNAKAMGGIEALKAVAVRHNPGIRLDDAMGDLDLKSGATGIVNPNRRPMSLGEAVVKSPAVAEWLAGNVDAEGNIRKGVKSPEVAIHAALRNGLAYDAAEGDDDPTVPAQFKGVNTKNLVFSAPPGAVAANPNADRVFSGPNRLPMVDLAPMADDLYLRQICTNEPLTGTGVWEYPTIVSKTNNADVVAEAESAAAIGAANTGPSSGTNAVVDAIIAGQKPESAMEWSLATGKVGIIAHHIPVTRNAAMAGIGIMSAIDQFLIDGLREKEEQQFLYGTGQNSPPQLQGLLNTTNPYTGLQTLTATGTDIDSAMTAISMIRKARFRPNWILINPDDWYTDGFLAAKDANGNYLMGAQTPRASVDQINTLWGLGVLVTQSVQAGSYIVGDFRQALVADRMGATIFMSDSHEDRFVRNILTVLAEERVGFGVRAPQAFVHVTP